MKILVFGIIRILQNDQRSKTLRVVDAAAWREPFFPSKNTPAHPRSVCKTLNTITSPGTHKFFQALSDVVAVAWQGLFAPRKTPWFVFENIKPS